MSNNLGYARKFIILKREFSNMKDINPKGHGKLEHRGNKVSISINIENAEKNSYYDIILVKAGSTYTLGRVYTDDNYSGKVEFNLSQRDLAAIGFPIEIINGILIMRDSDILLGGYFNKDDGSIEKHNQNISRMTIQSPAVQEDIVEEVSEEVSEEVVEELVEEKSEEIEEVIENKKEIIEEEIAYDPEVEVEKIQEEVPEEVDEPIASGIHTEEEYHRIMANLFQEPENIVEDVEEKQTKNSQTTNYILNILSFFPYIEPFKINLKGYNWWKIDIEDPQADSGFLPYFSFIVGGNHKYPIIKDATTANSLMARYGHYLFGLYNSEDRVKFYVYGVPGRFNTQEHPQMGNTGFNTWFESVNGMGYWLLYIDPVNGRIIYPINPMIPME